ncbi:helix-turn-helix domain-containing protein [Paenarthrobacter sp. R1]|uniref:helix-turn-helix domain-containing protein n=1 Tax=Paenarthrobacter sp. R1 TaxID=3049085 RepID=UPI002556E77A|nr:helix-turn-helix domain-containing protein [Paenarthrobacter sp. R1]WIV32222.1 helix-turn-helix domain-containing protein [Paenarthrobacter sp. R1]
MATRRPPALSDADKAYIKEAYERGDSHRDIAAHLNKAKSTVGQWMTRNGMRYDSTDQKAAIEKNVLSAQERISALRLDVIGIAEHDAAEIREVQRGNKTWKTVLRSTGGGEDVAELDFIPPNDKRSNASSLASHAGTIARLAPKEDGNQTAEVDSVMDKLINGLAQAFNPTSDGPAE